MRQVARSIRTRLLCLVPPFGRRQLSPGHLSFACNICGTRNISPLEQVCDRERPTCRACGSTLRFRSVIAALQERLLGNVETLDACLPRKHLRGLGMSDAAVYSAGLARCFDYANTFYHQPPLLDISNPDPSWIGRHDFLISSDVMEHVRPPVVDAFVNLRRLLRPGGVLVLTVPYVCEGDTLEHYPELHDYRIEQQAGGRRLVNITCDGRRQEFTDPVFHGGDGETLEMRLFSERGLLAALHEAGFIEIRIHAHSLPEWGIVNLDRQSLPVTARCPSP